MTTLRWLTRYGPEGASSRYRAYQFDDPLRTVGHHITFEPISQWRGTRLDQMEGISRRIQTLRGRIDEAVIAIQKEPVMPPLLWPTVRNRVLAKHPMIWDLDDAIWIGRAGAERMAADMARCADVVIAGNDLIGEWSIRHGADKVVVLPTCFDPHEFADIADAGRTLDDERAEIELVWIGSPATADRLQQELGSLTSALASPQVRLTCVGAPPFSVHSSNAVRFLPWSAEHEHRALSRADYGLSFLPRDEYSDHKCGFKLIQYLAYGVIPIATSSPVHDQIMGNVGLPVRPGPAGRVAVQERLLTPPTPSERAEARERWRSLYSVEVGARTLESVFAAL